ncbi:phosphoribosylglycinamide formyltransferase [Lachnoanaerobaculum umeaense]|jgi:phosphoribosylglycinamide formyltransferase|uniref:Phosphoribosylglycinamide formyltransferase n=1 Tax=Lachnoanaerobaculum umeaense TaxID=617123 RepID=A0A385PYC3_9FIRM|nr:phosphoribosylglycinamide formyltransferase [Lachnoanaerobaculum umeaense]AYA98992.1 phosphoribosylglycinamide formyltransferase [Lachnoanaerobaculum umeaense]PZW95183.1 formyltetrahydrofolate-dependent phosphoribosylglycinamide formyltransferase [Lachnoanaerobaculum umeaense]
MFDIVCLVSGGGTNLAAIIKAIEDKKIKNVRIKAVISNNSDAYALERARNAGIDVKIISPKNFVSRTEFDKALLDELKILNPDLIVLAGFLVNISKDIVEAFENKIINIHPSLIPSFCGKGYYGLKVHEAALERGVKITGATVHYVDSGIDTGRIIIQKPVKVLDGDDAKTLQKRVMEEAEWIILPKAIDKIANGESL